MIEPEGVGRFAALGVVFATVSACHPLHGWKRGERCDADDAYYHHDIDASRREHTGHLAREEVEAVISADVDNLETCYRWTLAEGEHGRDATQRCISRLARVARSPHSISTTTRHVLQT